MKTENLSTLKIHKLTKEQYERALEAGNIDENALYLTPEEEVDMSPYATVEQLNGKADFDHTHDEYLTAVPDEYITETELNSKGYLTAVPNEYITETELNAKGYLTAIPDEYVTETELNAKGYLTAVPDEYVTETELNTSLGSYESKNDAAAKLTEAKSYADTAATNAANTVKNDLLNGAGEAYDTLKELGDLISDNVDAIEALETVAAGKQDRLNGTAGQFVGFDENGNAVATDITIDAPSEILFLDIDCDYENNSWSVVSDGAPSTFDELTAMISEKLVVLRDGNGAYAFPSAVEGEQVTFTTPVYAGFYHELTWLYDGTKNFFEQNVSELVSGDYQEKITGTAGQFVVIGDDGCVTTKTVASAEEASF